MFSIRTKKELITDVKFKWYSNFPNSFSFNLLPCFPSWIRLRGEIFTPYQSIYTIQYVHNNYTTLYYSQNHTHPIQLLKKLKLYVFFIIFFWNRILREYDKVERTGYGSVSREMANCSAANQYVPSYTRAHYQTKPSAPPSHLTEEDQWRSRYDPYGYMETWRPLQTINGATY